MKTFFSVIVLYIFSCSCYSQSKEFIQPKQEQVHFEKLSFEELKAKAKKEKKTAFVYLNMAWCGGCREMQRNVLTDFSVATYYNSNFINGSYEYDTPDGQAIMEQYQIHSAPTYLFIDGDGNVLHHSGGSMSPEKFVQLAHDASNPQQRLAYYDSLYPYNKTNPEFLLYYLRMLTNTGTEYGGTTIENLMGLTSDALTKREQVEKEYFVTQKEDSLLNITNWDAIKNFTYDYKSREFTYLLKNAEAYRKRYSKEEVDGKIREVLTTTGRVLFIHDKPLSEASEIEWINEVKVLNSPETAASLFWLNLQNDEMYEKWDDYIHLVNDEGNKYIISSADKELVARIIYENIKEKTVLETAENMMKSAVLENPSWLTYETYANVLYELHKKSEAKSMANKALDRAKLIGAKKENYNSITYLLEKIEKLN